jgi:DNA-binding PadR family transcriptional regulator
VVTTRGGAGCHHGAVRNVRGRDDELLLNEWACLGMLGERDAHGFALAARLTPQGDVGRVWSLSRPLTYRALDQLQTRGLVEAVGTEPGRAGGPRTILGITAAGRAALARWLAEPVEHLRDVRAELLLKLVLAGLNGVDPRPLVVAQRVAFQRVLDALAAEEPPGDDPVARWRRESALAVARFLDGFVADRPTS